MAKKKASKKKKAPKRKAPKRKASKRKASKRKAPKRKASKRKASNPKRKASKRKNNATPSVKLELKPMGKTISSSAPQNLYHAFMKNGRDKMYIGHVTAKNTTEAKKKARAYLRKKV